MDRKDLNFEEGVAIFPDIVIKWSLVSVRGVAQLGSAPLWGSGGRGFESRRSDLKISLIIIMISFVRLLSSSISI